MTISQALFAAFEGILKAVASEPDESKKIARAKREVLALSLRLSSDALLRRMLK